MHLAKQPNFSSSPHFMDVPFDNSPVDAVASIRSCTDWVRAPVSNEPAAASKSDPIWEQSGIFATELAKPAKPKSSTRARRRIRCFECNRPEGHYLVSQHRWFYSYLLGLTFGLVTIVGPYQCQCCGSKRLMAFNALNPRYWVLVARQRGIVQPRNRTR